MPWKFRRWSMATLRCIPHHPCLLSVVLVMVLLVLTFMNTRLSLPSSYKHSSQEHSFIAQEQARHLHRNAHRPKPDRQCEIYSLQDNRDRTNSAQDQIADCQRIPPVPGSCDLADQIFFSEPPASCSHQQSFNFCNLQKTSQGKWEVACNKTELRACSSPLSVGKINKHTGSLVWEMTGSSLKTSKVLTSYVQGSSSTKHYGFCFIRCTLKHPIISDNFEDFDSHYYNNDREIVYAEQLLILPPQFMANPDVKPPSESSNININMMLVDSVSRQHFFRSLPNSVSALREIMSQPGASTAVLDFELVQAVRSRTFETLQTIFSGDIDLSEKPFGTQELPPRPLQLSILLKKFKDKGYHTLWIEDLCYLWEWGISKDLHFLNKSSSSQETWVRMWKTLSNNFIDSVEATLAMCKVLEANNVVDHFHGPDSVCFHGHHQHEYLLEYLQLYQQELESRKLPFFSFTMTNVAHEGTGRRVQTLDQSLAAYLKFSASLQNTLTLVFSDHGNAYGRFIHVTQEARIELFHPFMVLIIPRNVARILGNSAMTSLNINTQRLVSFLDLHYTLNHVIDPNNIIRPIKGQFRMSRKGLLETVSSNRSCDDIPRIMPNLCICQNYDAPIGNDTNLNLFAYFALGRLNGEIQRQLLESQIRRATIKSSDEEMAAFGKCEKLVLMSVHNMRRSFGQDRSQALKMDLHVQQGEVFFVAISVEHNSQGLHTTQLEMYDRLTPYGKYSVCADSIDLSLCICDMSGTIKARHLPRETDYLNMRLLPQFEMLVQNVDGCILLVTVKHASGAVIYLVNLCRGKVFVVAAAMEADNHLIYFSLPDHVVLLPGGMILLGLLYTDTDRSWTSSVRLSFQVKTALSQL